MNDDPNQKASLDVTSMDHDAAEKASRECPRCGGQGLTDIFKAGYEGSAVKQGRDQSGKAFTIVMRTSAYCVCSMGRWLAENHKKRCKDVYARIPDLYDVLAGKTNWLAEDPRKLPPVKTFAELKRLMDSEQIVKRA
jgi:hypothetical protein